MTKFKYQNQLPIILEEYKQGKTYVEIVKLLNSTLMSKEEIEREAGCIRRLLINQLGNIKGHGKVVITEENKQKIHRYLKENKAPIEIAKLLGIKYPTLHSYLQKEGLKFRPLQGNTHYFDTIDSYAKAYILGFIAADGALVPAKKGPTITLTITVKYTDKEVLEFIKSEIGNTHNIMEIIRPSSYDPTKIIHHARLSFSTPEIVQSIMKYGIKPRKSLTLGNIIQNIPYKFRDAFIIGYFDGDGSVHVVDNKGRQHNGRFGDNSIYINIRGTKSFLEGVCEHLNIEKSHIYQHDSIPSLTFANKKDTYRLYQCYQHLPFYYKRKYDKFLSKICHPSYDKYKQVQTISSSVV